MSYGADFATADPANAPLDPPLFIGADPALWGALILLLGVAALIGWLLGARRGSGPHDAAHAIWDAVDDAAKDAMKADTEALPAKAAHLRRVLTTRLGKTLAFGGELTGCVKALDGALKGEAEDKAAPPTRPEAIAATEHREAEPASASAAANVTIVAVHAAPAPTTAPASAPAPDKPATRPMTTRERNDALRLAVAAFNDYWRHRALREGEMSAVVAELCNPGAGHGHGGHGHKADHGHH